MELIYKNKRLASLISEPDNNYELTTTDKKSNNMLLFGDNFHVMKAMLYDLNLANTIDLVYIDPPFATNNKFTFNEERTSTISNSSRDEIAYNDNLNGYEYLEYIRERLILIRELMSINGSIYLHIDYKIGHYVKIIMDEIFGIENFKTDITRIKCNPKNFKRKSYGNIKDLILFYTKSKDYIWNEPKVEFTDDDINKLFKKIDNDGRLYTTIPLHAPGETINGASSQMFNGILPPKGRHWRSNPKELEKLDSQGLIEWSKNNVPRKKIYADDAKMKGKKLQDIWEFKDPQYPIYPTQKNKELLDLIISVSSNKESTVMDCFAGGGTALFSAMELQRNWIGIDNSNQSLKVIKNSISKINSNLFNENNYQYFELREKI